MQKNSVGKKSLFLIVSIIFFYIILTLVSDINRLSYNFLNVKIELTVFILSLVLLSLIIRSYRQQIFLKNIDVKIPFKDNVKIYFAGLSLVSTPGGIGMLIKSEILKKKFGITRSKTLPIVFIERYHDLLSILTLLIIALMFSYLWQSLIIILIFSVIISVTHILVQNKKLLSRFQSKLLQIQYIKKIIPGPETNESFYVLIKPKIMIYGWFISFASWIIEAFSVYFVFIAFGHPLEFFKTVQYYFTSLAYGAISLIPGGVGVTEGSLISILVSSGFEFSTASAIVLFIRLTTIWFATVIGIVTTKYSIT